MDGNFRDILDGDGPFFTAGGTGMFQGGHKTVDNRVEAEAWASEGLPCLFC